MASLDSKIFGTPKNRETEKENEVVKAPEFDLTQYAKKLAVMVPVVAGAVAGALKLFGVEKIDSAMVAGGLAVTAAALLGASLVMAIDLASRAYLAGGGSSKEGDGTSEASVDASPDGNIIPAPPGTVVWLDEDNDPHPVLALSGDGGKTSAYLVAGGEPIDRFDGERKVLAINGAPQWHPAEDVRAVKSSEWP